MIYNPDMPMPPADVVLAAGKVYTYMQEHGVKSLCGLTLDRLTNDEVRRQLGPTGKEKTRHG